MLSTSETKRLAKLMKVDGLSDDDQNFLTHMRNYENCEQDDNADYDAYPVDAEIDRLNALYDRHCK